MLYEVITEDREDQDQRHQGGQPAEGAGGSLGRGRFALNGPGAGCGEVRHVWGLATGAKKLLESDTQRP